MINFKNQCLIDVNILNHFVINIKIDVVKYEFGFKIIFDNTSCMQFFWDFF